MYPQLPKFGFIKYLKQKFLLVHAVLYSRKYLTCTFPLVIASLTVLEENRGLDFLFARLWSEKNYKESRGS